MDIRDFFSNFAAELQYKGDLTRYRIDILIIMDHKTVKVGMLIETSWEVCNKVGGIYTVLSTKAKTLHDMYGDKLIFIGPDVWTEETPSPYFTPVASLLKPWLKQLSLPEGVSVRVGRWNVPGKPIAILVKFEGMYAVKDQFYGRMWDLYGVDSLHAYGDYDEACAFSHAAGMVVESLVNFYGKKGGDIIAHFDEWTTGMGLLYTKAACPEVATIFTTHATCIGRSICGNGKPLYDQLKNYNGDQMARELNMESKHSLEKTAAHQADCFTTVSDITAVECEQLLERKPDVVTPNGFEAGFVPVKSKFGAAREKARRQLLEVASALCGAPAKEDDPFLLATAGRCEYRNKGLDIFLDVADKLRSLPLERRVIAFVLVPAWVKEPRADLREALDEGKQHGLPDPVLSHWINNPYEDAINCRIHALGFENRPSDKVSVIYVPCYLDGNDGIFGKSYYDLLIGFDATMFPSYYEPWGYTPLESVAFGVPTVTTSLSGFGQWVIRTANDSFEDSGVNVIGRNDSNYSAVVDNIARSLRFLNEADSEQRALISRAAMDTAARAAWQYFVTYYVDAFAIALESRDNRMA